MPSVRVRLMVAVPAVIVLLLGLLAGVLYWMTDAYFSAGHGAYKESDEDFARDWLKILWLFVVGGGVIGYVLAWSLTRPIHDMIRLTGRVATGDLKSKANVNRSDEMGQLGSSFNFMVESLNTFIETRNRFILESFTGGLVVTDLNGTITAVNSAAEKLLDIRSQDVSGKSVREVFSRPEFGELLRLHERVIWKQESIRDKRLEIQVGEKAISLVVGFTPMRDSAGMVFGVIINLRDSVEMEKFYEHLRHADRLATMGTFATGLAHEIRNPLGAIKATAQLLQEDLGPNSASAQYLHIITKEVNRLDQLVREVQAYSQQDGEKLPLDLNRLLEESIELARNNSRVSGRTFHLETHLEPLPRVRAAKNRLRQALLNVLINAFESVPEGKTVMVTAALATTPTGHVEIEIKNEGAPIPVEEQGRLFEPFYTTRTTGTGLGLPIAAQVMAAHRGRICVSCADGWVTFTLQIPVETTPLGQAEAPADGATCKGAGEDAPAKGSVQI